jgi:WD40 repeat protein
VRVTVLTRGLLLGSVTTALAALLAVDRQEGPGPARLAAVATLTKDGGNVTALALSPDGTALAVARSGDQVAIWDVASHERRWVLPTMSWDTGLAFSPDGKVLAVADQGPAIGLWSADAGESLGTLECPGRAFLWLAYSPDGRTLAAASRDDTVMLWDVPTARVRDTHVGHCISPNALAFSHDGRTLVFTERGGSIVSWDVERGRIRAEWPGHTSIVRSYEGKNVSLCVSPDGKTLASQGGFDPLVKLWDIESGRLLGTINVEPSLGQVVAFSADGRALILAGRGAVWEWDTTARRSTMLVDGLSPTQNRFAAAPEGGGVLAIAEGARLTLRQQPPRPSAGEAGP